MSYTLYSYWRSSCAYRVRIALHYKNIDHQIVPIHLLKNGGEQHSADYKKINPAGTIPALQLPDGRLITQSLAIIEYLDDVHRMPRLMPDDFAERAYVRQIAQMVGCDIHPLVNLRVLKELESNFGATDAIKKAWYQKWCHEGFAKIEEAIMRSPYYDGMFTCRDQVRICDLAIVSQIYNALRYGVEMADYPILMDIYNGCMELDYFQKAHPENQIDAEK
jgi:maleylacetoacetate isomerase